MKRKQKSSSTKAAVILICSMLTVWALASCTNDFSIPIGSLGGLEEEQEHILNEEQDLDDKEDVEQEVSHNDQQQEELEEQNNHQQNQTTDVNNTIDLEQVSEGASEEDLFDLDLEVNELSNETIGWSFKRNTTHEPVVGYNQGVDLQKYGSYYIVETNEKVVYLTFDEGYENGYTATILDTLKANDVQATFFVTESYIVNNPEITTRMKQEGHLVANHSSTHPSFPTITDDQIYQEIVDTQSTFEEVTGYSMDTFFRPPEGTFSERTLYLTRKLGYRTIFWSMAYADWNVNNQPGKEVAYQHVMDNYHPGAIILLHAVSESNTLALDDIIKSLKTEGYRFGSLYEVE